MRKLSPRKHIGDGKYPNCYWVFHYDQKFKRVKQKNGLVIVALIAEDKSKDDCLLGQFATFAEAIDCVNNKAYLPNVIIEDRLTGQVFEQICIVCQKCNNEKWESHYDVKYTQRKMEKDGYAFK